MRRFFCCANYSPMGFTLLYLRRIPRVAIIFIHTLQKDLDAPHSLSSAIVRVRTAINSPLPFIECPVAMFARSFLKGRAPNSCISMISPAAFTKYRRRRLPSASISRPSTTGFSVLKPGQFLRALLVIFSDCVLRVGRKEIAINAFRQFL